MSQATVTVFTFDMDSFSDLHKDALGFRPSQQYWGWLKSATDAEKQAEWNTLCETMGAREDQRKEDEQRALRKFNKLVAKTIASGAGTRKNAIRWLMDAMEHSKDDVELFEYLHGIPHGTVNSKKG